MSSLFCIKAMGWDHGKLECYQFHVLGFFLFLFFNLKKHFSAISLCVLVGKCACTSNMSMCVREAGNVSEPTNHVLQPL